MDYVSKYIIGFKLNPSLHPSFNRATATVEVFDGFSWKLQNYELTSVRSDHCAVPIGYTLYTF